MLIPDIDQVRSLVQERFDIVELAGHGGMGAVFKGRRLSLDVPVAIKVLPVPASLGADQLARFRREAMIAARLPHPNIIPVHEFEITGDMAYLVMPLIEGPSLDRWLTAYGRMTFPQVVELLQQIGGALQFAHDHGVIHRDVKPANILRDDATQRWMIGDFGIARGQDPTATALTGTGMVVGTPAYMAPEQAVAAPDVDDRVDTYALAAVAFEAVTLEQFGPHVSRERAEGMLVASGLSPRRARRLAAPLALEREHRPKSIRAWLDQLEGTHVPPWKPIVATIGLAAVAGALAMGIWSRSTQVGAVGGHTLAVMPFTVVPATPSFERQISELLEELLHYIPEYGVIRSHAVAERIDAERVSVDSVLPFAARAFNASHVVAGSATLYEDSLRLDVRVRATSNQPPLLVSKGGKADSLGPIVKALVSDIGIALGRPVPDLADATPSEPGALQSYLRGHDLFRRGQYSAARREYDLVIARDSTFAPAHFRRMLCSVMDLRPTRAGTDVRSAMDAARRYRDRLGARWRDLLSAYETVVARGELRRGYRQVTALTELDPTSVDAWLMKGYLEFLYAPLLGNRPQDAQQALQRAHALEPNFAVVSALLGWIAVIDSNYAAARQHWGRYLVLDSTSRWAMTIKMVDSLRLRGSREALAVTRSLRDRTPESLELLALAGGGLFLELSDREVTGNAVRALVDGAVSEEERVTAFRMQMANAYGGGRFATVDTLLGQARRQNVPSDELLRWRLIPAVTRLGAAVDTQGVTDAATRLADRSDASSLWLAARWFHGRRPEAFRTTRERLGTLRRPQSRDSLLAHSLLDDLDALEAISAGDTARALAAWERAIGRYQVEDVPFGLLASLWPIQLERARIGARRGDHDLVLTATRQFEHTAGFMDQVGWSVAIPLRSAAFEATFNRPTSLELYRWLQLALWDANGEGRASYADAVAAIERLGGRPRVR